MNPIDTLIHDLADRLKDIHDFGADVTHDKAARLFLSTIFGNHCPKCGGADCVAYGHREAQCHHCNQRHSLTASTAIARTKVSIRDWLAAIWHLHIDGRTISARGFGTRYGVDKMTAWRLLRKVRLAFPYFEMTEKSGVIAQVLGMQSADNHADVCVTRQGGEILALDAQDVGEVRGNGAKENALFHGRLKAWLTSNFHGVSKRYLWLYLAEFNDRLYRASFRCSPLSP